MSFEDAGDSWIQGFELLPLVGRHGFGYGRNGSGKFTGDNYVPELIKWLLDN